MQSREQGLEIVLFATLVKELQVRVMLMQHSILLLLLKYLLFSSGKIDLL